ncbi:acyl carrier protein [Streptomyces sanglieri]|uniref:Acyl carrier protein n=1 Tax=Streptomyces sanglieri TaxID=193460 RepID=A0ABW2X458_9ACTN
MTGHAPRVVAVSVDRQHCTDQLAGHPGAVLFRGTGPTPTTTSATAGNAAAEPRGRLRELLDEQAPAAREQRLAQIVQEMTGAILGDGSAVVDGAGFSDMGLDSIMVIDLRSRLSQALGVDLAATIALDHPTVTRPARHVVGLVFPAARGGAAAEPCEQDTAPVTATRPEEAAGAATEPEDLASLSFEELVRVVQADVRAEKTEKS